MPIRLRLALLFALGTAALLGAGGLAFEHQLGVGLLASIDAGLKPRADLLARSVSVSGGADGGSPVVPGTFSQIYDPMGRVSAASTDAGKTPFLDPRTLRAASQRPVFTSFVLNGRSLADTAGERVRVRAVPVVRNDGIWVAAVGTSLETADNAEDRVRRAVLLAGPPLVILAGIASWLLAGAALAPVERMRREVAEISEHAGPAAIAVPRTADEIARLATTMNSVLSRLTLALDRERQLVSDAGHELRTPLAILQGELELAGRPRRSRDELATTVETASEEVRRLVELTENLLTLGQGADSSVRLEPVVLADVADLAAATFAARAEAAQVTLCLRLDRTVTVDGDPSQLRRAAENLIDNGLRFAPDGSELAIVVARRGNRAVIAVSDTGPGFPADFLPHAFERFRRADDARSRAGGGTGLGLAIVQQVVTAHHGDAVAENRPTGGATVRIELAARPAGHHANRSGRDQ